MHSKSFLNNFRKRIRIVNSNSWLYNLQRSFSPGLMLVSYVQFHYFREPKAKLPEKIYVRYQRCDIISNAQVIAQTSPKLNICRQTGEIMIMSFEIQACGDIETRQFSQKGTPKRTYRWCIYFSHILVLV